MSTPRVSILTPTFNHAALIGDCIESVLAQSFPEWEMLVIDDGSSDSTPDVMAGYTDPRIQYFRLPHRGLSALAETYNHGLYRARGELVAILEADDTWPANKLARQVPAFDEPSLVLSWGRAEVMDTCGRWVSTFTEYPAHGGDVRLSTHDAFRALVRRNIMAPSLTVMLRRDALLRVGGFTQLGAPTFADLPTWLRVTALLSGEVRFIDAVLGHYRVHAAQTTQNFRRQMSLDHLSAVLAFADTLDGRTRSAVGWDETMRCRAVFSARLGEGVALYKERDYSEASRIFLDALGLAASAGERARALIGWISARTRIDLFAGANRCRGFLRSSARPWLTHLASAIGR